MTSPGNNGASYFFVDVHVSAGSINSVKAAAATKHRKYSEAWSRFRRDKRDDDATLLQYQQVNHSTGGRPEVVTFGVNYDGAFDDNAIQLMARLAEIKYPTNPNNRSYTVSRQSWINHYVRQIQLAVANGAAPAISLAIRNIKSQLVTSSMERSGNLDKGIPAFRREGNQYRELHEDKVAYASLNKRGETQLEATPPFNDGAVLDDPKDDRTHIRNESISTTWVKSTTNTNTDVIIENFQDGIQPTMKQDMTVMDETSDLVSREKDCLGELKTGCLRELMSVVAGENVNDKDNAVLPMIDSRRVGDEMTEDTSSTQENGDEMTEDTNVNNRDNAVLRAASSIMMDEKEESDYSESPSIDMYTTNTQDLKDEMSGAKRRMQLTKDYVTGNETFKKGSIGTVIEETTRKDRKLKIKLDKDTKEKKYRLIKETDLQAYTFKNEKEVVCLNEKNCQSNSSNSDEDLSIEY
jgi:hypothetical protein